MTPLKVGDRVMVYGWVQKHHKSGDARYEPRLGGKATVMDGPTPSGGIYVRFDDEKSGIYTNAGLGYYPVHPKQCRRLVKKPRRRVWVNAHPTPEGHAFKVLPKNNFVSYDKDLSNLGWIEFTEVRKKK